MNTDNVYTCAATNGKDRALILTHYSEDDTEAEAEVKVDFCNLTSENGVKASYYLLDETHDGELVREEIYTTTEGSLYLTLPLYSSYLIKFTAI